MNGPIPTRLRINPLLQGLVSALALGVPASQAAIEIDPTAAASRQPQLLQSANGTPLVNIQTPSAAGVSHNAYRRFDIEQQGVILNNARQNASTQLGGWIQGNPNLAGGSVRVILNEINSSDPSRLNGFVEVGGDKAELVIANPAGIQCDGCGFINASRATLSTGRPIIGQGRLEGYRVEGGEIAITGDGMDARGADYAQLISRALRLNAGIWANRLGITSGSNRVDAEGQVIESVSGQGPAPAFALDVASLGGMYANQIRLFGSEAGLGVNNGGRIEAGTELTLGIDGRLGNAGSLTSGGTLSITAGDIDNPGEIAATGDATVQTSGRLDNASSISTQYRLRIDADTLHNQGGARLSAPNLALQAREIENHAGALVQGETLDLHGSGQLNNRGRIEGDEIQIDQPQIDSLGGGGIVGGRVSLNTDRLEQRQESGEAPLIGAREQLELAAAQLDNGEQAWLFSAGDLLITGQELRNQGGSIEALGNLQITADRLENLNAGVITRQVDDPTRYQELIQPSGDASRYPVADCQGIGGGQDGNRCNGRNGSFEDYSWLKLTASPSHTELVSSRPGRILADGDIRLQLTELLNQDSQILSGATLAVQASDLQNLATQGQDVTRYSGTAQFTWIGWCGGFFSKHHCRKWGGVTPYEPAPELGPLYDLPTTRLSGQSQPDHDLPSLAASGSFGPLADSALFSPTPDSSANYLLETDPAFADYRHWLSSDYMLGQLGLDPRQMLKRLGDGFYEQRLVQQQLQEQRGNRLLAGFSDGEAQFRALMESGIAFAQEWNLVPGVRLSAGQMAALTHDIVWLEPQSVALADGSSRQLLVPRLYLTPTAGDLDRDGGLLAGRRIEIDLGDGGRLVNSASLAADDTLRLTAGRIDNPGGTLRARSLSVLAKETLTSSGVMQADELLQLESEGDLALGSVIGTSQGADGARQDLVRQAALYLTDDAARLIARAGGNLSLDAVRIDNPGLQSTTRIEAAGDIELGSRRTGQDERITWDSDNRLGQGRWIDQGTQIQSGGDIQLQAGGDLETRGASIQSSQGSVTLESGGDMRLLSGVETRHWEEARKITNRDLLSSTTRISRHSSDDTLAQGSSLGGRELQLRSGGDTRIEGAQLVADEAVTLRSGGKLDLQAAQQRHQESHYSEKRKSGLFSSGGLSLTLGRQKLVQTSEQDAQTLSASTLGSTGGDLQLDSGGRYRQQASDLLAPGGDIRISAPSIEILSGTETRDQQQQTRFSQSGITASISNPVINAAQTVQRLAQASRQTDNPRMKSLAAATAGLAIYDAYAKVMNGQGETIHGKSNQVPTGKQTKDGKAETRDARWDERVGGININLSLGSSSNQSESSSHQETIHASRVAAVGDITLDAEDPTDGDITIRGSDLSAVGRLALNAKREITVEAARAENTERSQNRSKSGSVGVSFGTAGFSINASASQGKGSSNGDETIHRNAHLESQQTAQLTSQGDTRLSGAVIKGKGIRLNTGGNLTIESLQDSQEYSYRQKDTGINVSYGTSLSGGINLDLTRVDGHYRSVVEQSGLQAGDDGFQVDVGGDTKLTGAVIASNRTTEAAKRNRLTTATLSTADLSNQANAEVDTRGYQLNSDVVTQGRYGALKSGLSNAFNHEGMEQSRTGATQTVVSKAEITITNEARQRELTGLVPEQVKAQLAGDTTNSNTPVEKIDTDALREQAEAERAITQEAIRQFTTLTDYAYRVMFEEIPKFYKVTCPAGVNCTKNPKLATFELLTRTPEEIRKELQNAPAGAVVAVNGIENPIGRAAQLAMQNAELVTDNSGHRVKPETIYLMHYKPTGNTLSELALSLYEKSMVSTFGYSNQDKAYAAAIASRQQKETVSLGHSRGTIVQTNANKILASKSFTNPSLSIRGVGGAVNAQDYFDTAIEITGEKSKNNITYNTAVPFRPNEKGLKTDLF